jgi:leader peptidase (prepilin peptidase)/N-methyltransferase
VTAGLRLARGEQTTAGRSHCDACGAGLAALETLPVVSYISLRGGCRRCGARIDPLHLAGEFAGLLIVIAAVWAAPPVRALAVAAMGLALLAAAAIDLRARRLPDFLTSAVALCALALSATRGPASLAAGAVAAVLIAGVMLLVRAASRRRSGEVGLGLGDVKLMAALALWLGTATPLMVAAASALGLLAAPFWRGADRRIPFGPMIGVAGWTLGLLVERGWSPWAL